MVAFPLICITLLTVYNINTAINRENVNLQNRGEKLLLLAANAAELALFAGDISTLKTLRSAIMHDSQISDALFFDEDRQLLTGPSKNGLSTITDYKLVDYNNQIEGDYWYFTKSVKLSTEPYEEDQEQFVGSQDAATLGWVMLVIDLSESRDYQNIILRNNLIISLVMLSVALWLAFRFSHAVVEPITNITMAVVRYGNEDFSQRVDEISSGELGSLEKGINNLAKRVGQSQLILKEEVEKATKDLEDRNVDLAKAKEAADSANIAKDDFLARMSHELRTPLTGIMGFTRLLAKTDQELLRREYCDMIITSSSVLLSTINDILDFSKLQANSFSLNPVQFNLENCLRSVMDLHRVAAFDKDIELNVLIDSDIPVEVFADIDKLQKIVNNIIGNAVKFTSTGDIVMFVSRDDPIAGEALISVSVKDSGIGISADNMKYLFNPFYQSDESNTRRHDGTGLGLAIAEDFVTLMGGSISVDSEEGEGTEVKFSFRCRIIVDTFDRPIMANSFRAVIFDNNAWTRRSWRNQLLKYSDDVCAPSTFDDLIDTLKNEVDVLLLGFNYHEHSVEQMKSTLERTRAGYKGAIILAVADDGSAALNNVWPQYQPLLVISKPLTNNRLADALQKVNAELLPEIHLSTPVQPLVKSRTFNSSKNIAGLNILVAEDNKFNQTLLARLLEATGASVTLASNGLEAMRLADKHHYDVLVLDLHMPGLNGLQLSSAIRKSSENTNYDTPIILLTADVLSRQEPEILAAGVDAISYKPIDEDDLIDKISSLSRKAPRLELEARPEGKRTLITLSASQISEEVSRQLELIQLALSAKNLEALEHQVHQLTGVIGLAGLNSIRELVQYLSTAIKTGDLDGARECFERLTEHWSEIGT